MSNNGCTKPYPQSVHLLHRALPHLKTSYQALFDTYSIGDELPADTEPAILAELNALARLISETEQLLAQYPEQEGSV